MTRPCSTGEKNKSCPSCDFKTSDPAALTRHRKREHGYVPQPRRARSRSSSSGSSRSISPAELSLSTATSPACAESIQVLHPVPRPFFTKHPVLEQGNVVSAPAPVTLQPANLTQLYSPTYLPEHASEEQPPTVYIPQEHLHANSSEYQPWDNQLDHSCLETSQSQYTSNEITTPPPPPPLFQPNSSTTVCAPIKGYHQHFAIDDDAYETMFYNPLLQLQYFMEFQCQDLPRTTPSSESTTSFESFDLGPQTTVQEEPYFASQGYDHRSNLSSIPWSGYQWDLEAYGPQ